VVFTKSDMDDIFPRTAIPDFMVDEEFFYGPGVRLMFIFGNGAGSGR
jgi:hypothetical protein